jgi:hypothetical protein
MMLVVLVVEHPAKLVVSILNELASMPATSYAMKLMEIMVH